MGIIENSNDQSVEINFNIFGIEHSQDFEGFFYDCNYIFDWSILIDFNDFPDSRHDNDDMTTSYLYFEMVFVMFM